MALAKLNQKTMVFSSERARKLIDGIGKIKSEVTKTSQSVAIEQIVLDATLPENETAKRVAERLFLEEISIWQSYEGIFQVYAAGVNNGVKYENGEELVNNLKTDMMFASMSDFNKGELAYLAANYKVVVDIIRNERTSDNEENLSLTESPVKYAEHFLNEIKEEPEAFIPFNVVDVICRNWDVVGSNSYTYRTLVSLMKLISKNSYDSEMVMRFVSILKKLSADWK